MQLVLSTHRFYMQLPPSLSVHHVHGHMALHRVTCATELTAALCTLLPQPCTYRATATNSKRICSRSCSNEIKPAQAANAGAYEVAQTCNWAMHQVAILLCRLNQWHNPSIHHPGVHWCAHDVVTISHVESCQHSGALPDKICCALHHHSCPCLRLLAAAVCGNHLSTMRCSMAIVMHDLSTTRLAHWPCHIWAWVSSTALYGTDQPTMCCRHAPRHAP